MVVRRLALATGLAVVLVTRAGAQEPDPQGMPNPQAMQMQVQQIMMNRPREAEAAARAFLQSIMRDPGQGPVEPRLAELDSLKQSQPDAYWGEVAQLTVQFQMVQNLARRDSVRAGIVVQMFGLEMRARAVQRAYRTASDAQRQDLRTQLTSIMLAHFEMENNLRSLEIADISRRLANLEAETRRRREKRDEFIRFAVDDVIRDAVRPR